MFPLTPQTHLHSSVTPDKNSEINEILLPLESETIKLAHFRVEIYCHFRKIERFVVFSMLISTSQSVGRGIDKME